LEAMIVRKVRGAFVARLSRVEVASGDAKDRAPALSDGRRRLSRGSRARQRERSRSAVAVLDDDVAVAAG